MVFRGARRLAVPALAALALGASACAVQAPARPPRPPRRPDPEVRKLDDRKYYAAVDAYMKADYPGARALLAEILAADPANADARALLARVKAVEKASAPPP